MAFITPTLGEHAVESWHELSVGKEVFVEICLCVIKALISLSPTEESVWQMQKIDLLVTKNSNLVGLKQNIEHIGICLQYPTHLSPLLFQNHR